MVAGRQLTLQAVESIQHQRWEEAERLLTKALQACPLDERVHWHYAQVLWQLGRQDPAVAHMEKAVQLSGGDAELLVHLGEMYLGRGDLEKARHAANRASERGPELASVWALQGDILRGDGQLEAARTSYYRALKHQPHFPHVQVAVAQIYYDIGRHHRTLGTLDTLVQQLPPGDAPVAVLHLQGRALKQLGRTDEAVQCLSQAVAAGSPGADLLFDLAEAQWLHGDVASARLTLSRSLAVIPRHRPSLELQNHLASLQPPVATASLAEIDQR